MSTAYAGAHESLCLLLVEICRCTSSDRHIIWAHLYSWAAFKICFFVTLTHLIRAASRYAAECRVSGCDTSRCLLSKERNQQKRGHVKHEINRVQNTKTRFPHSLFVCPPCLYNSAQTFLSPVLERSTIHEHGCIGTKHGQHQTDELQQKPTCALVSDFELTNSAREVPNHRARHTGLAF